MTMFLQDDSNSERCYKARQGATHAGFGVKLRRQDLPKKLASPTCTIAICSDFSCHTYSSGRASEMCVKLRDYPKWGISAFDTAQLGWQMWGVRWVDLEFPNLRAVLQKVPCDNVATPLVVRQAHCALSPAF